MSLENKETKPAQENNQGTETKTQAAENGLPKTQEELDAIINARLARERKKMASQQQGQTPPAQTETNVQPAQQQTQPPAVDTAVQQENLMLKAQVVAIKDGIRTININKQ